MRACIPLVGLLASSAMAGASVRPAAVQVTSTSPKTAAQDAAVQDAADNRLQDVVVTARKKPPSPKLDAIGYYRRYCYEPNRLTGRSAPPLADPEWEPLDDRTRAQFGIADPDVPAFSLVDSERGSTLLVKFERLSRADGLTESRCTW